MMKNRFRPRLTKLLTGVTSFLYVYFIATTPLSFNKSIGEKTIPSNPSFSNNKINELIEIKLDQKSLSKKVYSDFYYHGLLPNSGMSAITQINLNKEGRIVGCKPRKLQLINYSLEEKIVRLLRKNIFFARANKSIYWLELTNKY